jgi:hypothetical protein
MGANQTPAGTTCDPALILMYKQRTYLVVFQVFNLVIILFWAPSFCRQQSYSTFPCATVRTSALSANARPLHVSVPVAGNINADV